MGDNKSHALTLQNIHCRLSGATLHEDGVRKFSEESFRQQKSVVGIVVDNQELHTQRMGIGTDKKNAKGLLRMSSGAKSGILTPESP
jgi:hypothetical protein